LKNLSRLKPSMVNGLLKVEKNSCTRATRRTYCAPRFIFDVHNHLFLYSSWVHGQNSLCVECCISIKLPTSFIAVIWASLTLTITVTLDLFFLIRLSLISQSIKPRIKLHCPSKSEESQKHTNTQRKNHFLPGTWTQNAG
jgi:hypothetical protein